MAVATVLFVIGGQAVRCFAPYRPSRDVDFGVATAVDLDDDRVVDDALLLRALSYFDDADREARLPNEGPRDWTLVKDFFLTQVGTLLAPPRRRLAIQAEVVDVRP